MMPAGGHWAVIVTPGAQRKNFAEHFGLWLPRGAPTPTAVGDLEASWDGGSRV